MIRLGRDMLARYEIAPKRPQTPRCVLLGADGDMRCGVARLLDEQNAAGADLGALCVSADAAELRAQDNLFTILIRGEAAGGAPVREERVVQCLLEALNPEDEFEKILDGCARPEIELIFGHARPADAELALLARLLFERWRRGLDAPAVVLVGRDERCVDARAAVWLLARGWAGAQGFEGWLSGASFVPALVEGLYGAPGAAEQKLICEAMNYRDARLAWAEPTLMLTAEGAVPPRFAAVFSGGDYARACAQKARVFDAALFLCAAGGALAALDDLCAVLRQPQLRAWIGHAFFDELIPALDWPRAQIEASVISCFDRLENAMNAMPPLEFGADMMSRLPRTLLPAIRFCAEKRFEAPPCLSFALAAAILLYAGARRSQGGGYELKIGDAVWPLRDDAALLNAFSRLSRDMPAEALSYAALADRALWGEDLREIDGLEMRVCYDISTIQRIGFGEALKLKLLEMD